MKRVLISLLAGSFGLLGAATSGAQCLSFLGDVADGAGGAALLGAFDVEVARDGENLYVTAFQEDALSIFTRDPATGAATFYWALRDGVSGVDGLDGPREIATSPDGKHVYVTSSDGLAVFAEAPASPLLQYVEMQGDPEVAAGIGVDVSPDGKHVYVADVGGDRVVIYARDPATGELTHLDAFDDGQESAPLHGVQDVAVSPDGAQVYAVATDDNAFLRFDRDPATGLLDLAGYAVDGSGGVIDGLDFAYRIALSPDARHIYVSSAEEDAIAIFARDGSSVAFQEVVKDGVNGVVLVGVRDIAVSPDGLRVFVTQGAVGDGIVAFARDPATGSLRQAETRQDGNAPEDLLNFATGLGVSPDGRNLYVAAYNDHALTSYAWPDALREVQTLRDGADGVEGLDSAIAATFSPDLRHLYVAGFEDDSIAVFARDRTNGTLAFVEFERNGVGGVSGLDGPQGIALSSDGRHLYASAGISGAVAVFARNATTGALSFVQSRRDGIAGVDGIGGATAVLVSPDGAHVYVGGYNDGAIARFARDPAGGGLTFLGAIFDGEGGADGLQGAGGILMAMDRTGRHLYVAGSNEAALTVFERNAASGALAHVQTLRDGIQASTLDFAFAALLSPDESLLYVTSLLDDALSTFVRDPQTGVLDFLEAERDGLDGVTDLVQPRGIARSADGRHLFAAAQSSGALVAFDHDPALASNTFAASVVDGSCVEALQSASGLAVAGRWVYATAYSDDAVMVFAPESAAAMSALAAIAALIGAVARRRRRA
jgi:6-phosphogluconolactonase (cycloisomerase 2 family)